jgi:putative toxin-antitoxin system antitoxin component (TIGR02293 family)
MAKLKDVAALQDDVISKLLNISVKTFRHYKKPQNTFKDNIKEKVILLISLFEHGIDIFGSQEDFYKWLNSENFFFDDKTPITYLTTVTGIRYVDDRLTAMEYGDNI